MSTPVNVQSMQIDTRGGEALATSLHMVMYGIAHKVLPSLAPEESEKFFVVMLSRLLGQVVAEVGPDETMALLDLLKQGLMQEAPAMRAHIAQAHGGLN